MTTWGTVTEGEMGGSLERTDRLRVPGGWIYRATITATRPNGELTVAAAVAVDTVFVPAGEPPGGAAAKLDVVSTRPTSGVRPYGKDELQAVVSPDSKPSRKTSSTTPKT